MDAIVFQPESDHQRADTQNIAEVAGNRDRSTSADERGILPPFILQRLARAHEVGTVNRKAQPGAAAE